eukprot:6645062-Pyramimonas_sp.AAC.1
MACTSERRTRLGITIPRTRTLSNWNACAWAEKHMRRAPAQTAGGGGSSLGMVVGGGWQSFNTNRQSAIIQ